MSHLGSLQSVLKAVYPAAPATLERRDVGGGEGGEGGAAAAGDSGAGSDQQGEEAAAARQLDAPQTTSQQQQQQEAARGADAAGAAGERSSPNTAAPADPYDERIAFITQRVSITAGVVRCCMRKVTLCDAASTHLPRPQTCGASHTATAAAR